MNLIAIRDTVTVYGQGGAERQVTFGNSVGTLAENKNDGTLLLRSGELVDIDSVAIKVEDPAEVVEEPIKPVLFKENGPKKNAVSNINTDQASKTIKIRKTIAFALLITGTYLIFNGRKSVGITAVVFGFMMLKRNEK